jgi:hypothetical protein
LFESALRQDDLILCEDVGPGRSEGSRCKEKRHNEVMFLFHEK